MIRATQQLLQYLSQTASVGDYSIVSAYESVILSLGGPEDGDALIDLFLEKPSETFGFPGYGIMGKLGSREAAARLFDAVIEKGKLKEEFEPDLLEVLGNLKYGPVKPVLAEYALGDYDYYPNCHAVLGLLNFDCSDLQEPILKAIEAVYGQNLFNEYLPALVCKLAERKEVLERLYATGTEYCSTDCNAGIVLGFSLCGQEGLPYFRKALFNPAWEAYGPPVRSFVKGMQHLGITFSELYREVRSMQDPKQQEYAVKVLVVLLERAIEMESPLVEGQETWRSLRQHLFAWKNGTESDNIEDLARKYGWEDDVQKVNDILPCRIREELLLEHFVIGK